LTGFRYVLLAMRLGFVIVIAGSINTLAARNRDEPVKPYRRKGGPLRRRSGILAVLVAAVAAVGLTGPAHAATSYYVCASGGSDSNDGTSTSTPWATLTKVSSTAFGAGDRIVLCRGGSWDNQVLTLTESGTSTARIAVYGSWFNTSLANVRPVLSRSSAGDNDGHCVDLAGDWLQMDNLKIDNCGYTGVRVHGDDAVVKNSEVRNNAAGIRLMGASDRALVRSNVLVDNDVMNVLTVGGNDDSGAFGVLVNGRAATIEKNTFSGHNAFSHDYGRDGCAVEIYGGSLGNADNNLIRYNRSDDDNCFSEQGSDASHTADNNDYYYNRVLLDCGANCDQAAGIILRGMSDPFGPTTNVNVVHNTVKVTGSTSDAFVCSGSCPTSTSAEDNIFRAGRTGAHIDAAGVDHGDNIFEGDSLDYYGFTINARSKTGEPGFVSTTNLHLRSGTSAAAEYAGSAHIGYTTDLDGVTVPQNGNCSGGNYADSGTYEYDPPGC
jgi:hypothetical protein